MSEERKEYDPEMRGALYEETDRKNEKSPIATGKITVSGVELRVAMWGAQVSKGESKKKYWPLKVEYRQGTRFVLAKVKPENIVVAGATAEAPASDGAGAPGDASASDVCDMPF